MSTTTKKKSPTKKAASMSDEKPTTITAFKGFDAKLQCRGFQYEFGKAYEHDGKVEACSSGFHACEHPLDVFGYYPPAQSRFAEVTLAGKTHSDGTDTKIAAAKITINVELSIGDLVKRAWDYVWSRAKIEEGGHATGDRGAASATGHQGAASATGYQGAASATGYQGAASATGYRGAASATGDRGAASATGHQGAASATGDRGAASATGYQGAASATGYQGAASATGHRGAAMSSGYEGRASGKDGNAIFLVERDDDYNIVAAWAGIVGSNGIKADVFYMLRAGKPVEVV